MTIITLENAKPPPSGTKLGDWEVEQYTPSDEKELLLKRGILLALELELMTEWQTFNRNKPKEDQLPWDLKRDSS